MLFQLLLLWFGFFLVLLVQYHHTISEIDIERTKNVVREDKKLNKYEKKKIVKCIILAILLFVVTTIIIIAMTTLDLHRNVYNVLVVVALPFIIIPIVFIREKKFYDSIKFGAIIGYVSGMIFSICWVVVPLVTMPNTNNEPILMLVVVFFIISTLVCTGENLFSLLLL